MIEIVESKLCDFVHFFSINSNNAIIEIKRLCIFVDKIEI